jgi:uncharacterized protein (TIGR04255 family)
MVAKGTPLPERIDPDAILEALLELRFNLVAPLPEVLFGRLAEVVTWKDFGQRKLPAYDLPAPFREHDPTLRFVPVFELTGANPRRAIRVGAHVLSYHHLPPYAGWAAFSQELHTAIDALFDKTEGLNIERLGMRYINALTPALHGIASVADLDVNVAVSQAPVRAKLNLNFAVEVNANTDCVVRLGTPEFVQGQVPPDTSVFVDVDVFTKPGFQCTSREEVKQWLTVARAEKNEAFLGLFTREALNRLGVRNGQYH